MSVTVMGWALAQRAGSPGAKCVLLALADTANDDGVCWPGLKRVAHKAEMSERAVRDNLERLVDAGLLRREQRWRANGSQTSNLYVLALEGPPADSAGRKQASAHEPSPSGPSVPPEGSGVGVRSEEASGTSSSVDAVVPVAPRTHAHARAAASELPPGFPADLRRHAEIVLELLREVALEHGAKAVSLLALGRVMMRQPRKPFVSAAYDLASWAAAPPRPVKDVVGTYRTWLSKCPDLEGLERLDADGHPAAGPVSSNGGLSSRDPMYAVKRANAGLAALSARFREEDGA